MGVRILASYRGSKKVDLRHEPSASCIATDAPKDNQGEGSLFSPTDLVAAALGSCIMTTLAIFAERDGLSLDGMHLSVVKEMELNPRRIGALPVELHLPIKLDADTRQKLERVAHTCPVTRSLAAEVKVPISFLYDLP